MSVSWLRCVPQLLDLHGVYLARKPAGPSSSMSGNTSPNILYQASRPLPGSLAARSCLATSSGNQNLGGSGRTEHFSLIRWQCLAFAGFLYAFQHLGQW